MLAYGYQMKLELAPRTFSYASATCNVLTFRRRLWRTGSTVDDGDHQRGKPNGKPVGWQPAYVIATATLFLHAGGIVLPLAFSELSVLAET